MVKPFSSLHLATNEKKSYFWVYMPFNNKGLELLVLILDVAQDTSAVGPEERLIYRQS